MKKTIMILLMVCSLPGLKAQLSIQSQTHWVVSGNTTIELNNINFFNNGNFNAGQGSILFSGNSSTTISGGSAISLNNIILAKNGAAKLSLLTNVNIANAISFVTGQLDLNNNNIILASNANLLNESETSRIVGLNGGYVQTSRNMNAPSSINAGNLGTFITSADNLGTVTIRRGHVVQTGIGLPAAVQRYYQVSTQNNSAGMNLRLSYFDTELNGQNETTLVQYQSPDAGINWNNLGMTSRNSNANYVEKSGINQLGLFTLAIDQASGPVGALSFSGTRKKSTEVQLNWTSASENNMSHYIVQRKLSTELSFVSRATVNSLALNGNSASSLIYKYTDPNSHTGNSTYRLAIVDKNGATSFSSEIIVAAKTNGAKGGGNPNNLSLDESLNSRFNGPLAEMEKSLLVGPNPNNGNFWFNLRGVSKNTDVMLYGIDGKIVKLYRANNQERVNVTGLSRGMYLLKAEGLDPVKIIVQ